MVNTIEEVSVDNSLLHVSGLDVYYGPIKAIRNVSLDVKEGEIVAILGANGAGKTTLLKAITGIVKAKKGTVYFNNEDITGLQPEKIVVKNVSLVPEHRQVFGTLTVLDNLYLGAFHHYRKIGKKVIERDIEQVFEMFPILKERKKQLAGTLSGGQQQMLAIARGVMSRPKLLLLDEPTLGLAPIVTKEVLEMIVELNRVMDTTVLLIEQNVVASLKIAKRAYVISGGEIVQAGSAEELLADEKVRDAYLGQKVRS
jgi:branched-chain amino acid transport system ATP-binding protein